MKPVIAISAGDPSGIGPEVCVASLPKALGICRPVVFGHLPSLRDAARRMGVSLPIEVSEHPTAPAPGNVTVVPTEGPTDPITAHEDAAAFSQFAALEQAVTSVLEGECDALVTAPVSKALIARVHPGFTGHTEYLAGRSGLLRDEVTMVFASRDLSVALVATHVPMCKVAETVTEDRYERTAGHLLAIIRGLHPNRAPRIAVAAFNPHAGEDGLLGTEERDLLEPFCAHLSEREDAEVSGPIPADTVYRDALAGRYDGVVAAYHDQAMIPLKLMGPGKTVNVTMGLPFVRTSPDHGTAYDLAGTGKADPTGMIEAIEIAVALHRR